MLSPRFLPSGGNLRSDIDNNGMTDNSMGHNHFNMSQAPYSGDQHSSTNGPYDTNISGWNSGVTSRGSPQTSVSTMDHQHNRSSNSMGGFSQNHSMNMHNHSHDWHGQGGHMRGSESMTFSQHQQQMNYNSGSDFNCNGSIMSMGGRNQASNRSSNRFASSQMSQMGSGPGQRGSFIQGPGGTGGSNAQGRALNKMLLEILR